MSIGNFVQDEFEDCGLLGTGIYGNLTLLKHQKSEKYYVEKTIKSEKLRNVEHEKLLEIASKCLNFEHRNINKIHKFSFDDKQNLKILMDYCKKSSFGHFLNKKKFLENDEIFTYFFQILISVEFLHSKDIIHGNIKPNNFVFTDENLLSITDYFLTNLISEEEYKENRTWNDVDFTPPEFLKKSSLSQKSDFWALGVFLYRLIEGELPFSKNEISTFEAKELIKNFSFEKNSKKNFFELSFSHCKDNDMINLVKLLMNPNPEKRPSFDEIYEHPVFFKNTVKFGISLEKVRKKIYGKDFKMRRFKEEGDEDTADSIQEEEEEVDFSRLRLINLNNIIEETAPVKNKKIEFLKENLRKSERKVEENFGFYIKTFAIFGLCGIGYFAYKLINT